MLNHETKGLEMGNIVGARLVQGATGQPGDRPIWIGEKSLQRFFSFLRHRCRERELSDGAMADEARRGVKTRDQRGRHRQ